MYYTGGPITWRRGSVRDDQHVDREVLRCPTFGRRAAHDLSERRAELLLHEALESLGRLPDVVDVVALLALAGAVDYQPLRRLVFTHGGGVPKHLLGDVVVNLLRELRRCRQDSNRHLASSWFRGRRILGRYVQAGRERKRTPAQAVPLATSVPSTRSLMEPCGCNPWPSPQGAVVRRGNVGWSPLNGKEGRRFESVSRRARASVPAPPPRARGPCSKDGTRTGPSCESRTG